MGEYQDFPSKVFCLTVPKISVGEAFTVAKISGIEKIWIRVGGVSRFSVETFLFHSAEIFVVGLFSVSVFSGTEKVWIREGGGSIKNFRQNFFVAQSRKFP